MYTSQVRNIWTTSNGIGGWGGELASSRKLLAARIIRSFKVWRVCFERMPTWTFPFKKANHPQEDYPFLL